MVLLAVGIDEERGGDRSDVVCDIVFIGTVPRDGRRIILRVGIHQCNVLSRGIASCGCNQFVIGINTGIYDGIAVAPSTLSGTTETDSGCAKYNVVRLARTNYDRY